MSIIEFFVIYALSTGLQDKIRYILYTNIYEMNRFLIVGYYMSCWEVVVFKALKTHWWRVLMNITVYFEAYL